MGTTPERPGTGRGHSRFTPVRTHTAQPVPVPLLINCCIVFPMDNCTLTQPCLCGEVPVARFQEKGRERQQLLRAQREWALGLGVGEGSE